MYPTRPGRIPKRPLKRGQLDGFFMKLYLEQGSWDALLIVLVARASLEVRPSTHVHGLPISTFHCCCCLLNAIRLVQGRRCQTVWSFWCGPRGEQHAIAVHHRIRCEQSPDTCLCLQAAAKRKHRRRALGLVGGDGSEVECDSGADSDSGEASHHQELHVTELLADMAAATRIGSNVSFAAGCGCDPPTAPA